MRTLRRFLTVTNVTLMLVVSVAAFQVVQVGCGGERDTADTSEGELGYGYGYGYGYGHHGYGYGHGGGAAN
jgi:hypothetical protein